MIDFLQKRACEKRERLRSLQAKLPKRDRQQDLSWMEEEYEAAKPSIIRAMELEEDNKALTAEQNAERLRTTRRRFIEERGGILAVFDSADFIDGHRFKSRGTHE